MPAKKNSIVLLPEDQYAPTEADRQRAEQEVLLGMVAPSAAILTQKAAAVPRGEIDSEHVKQIISRLFDTALGQRRESRNAKENGR